MENESVRLVDRWRQGDDEAATLLYEQYFEKLLMTVDGQLSDRYKQQCEPEDILQSAFGTVFRRITDGDFRFDNDEDVWKLLVTVVLNKLRRRVRHMNADRRDVRRQVAGAGEFDDFLAQQLSGSPGTEEAATFSDLMTEIFSLLSEEEKKLLQLRMEGCSQLEIAETLDVTDRTIRRMWDRIRKRLERLFDGYPG